MKSRQYSTLAMSALAAALPLAVHVWAGDAPAVDPQSYPLTRALDELPPKVRVLITELIQRNVAYHDQLDDLRELREADEAARKAIDKFLIDAVEFGYSGKPFPKAKEQKWGAVFVLVAVPPDIVLEAIGPELNLGGRLYGVLTEGDRDLRDHLEYYRSSDSQRSLHVYLEFLSRHDPEEASGVIEYLLVEHSRSAFGEMLSIYEKQLPDHAMLLALHHEFWAALARQNIPDDRAHDLRPARESVEYFARHAQWWIRLHAAEMMRQHAELRRPELIEPLKKDEDSLVRRAIDRIQAM
jgi:hypothetical protein